MNRQKLERYATLKIELAKIVNEIEFLQPEILKEVIGLRGDTTNPIVLPEFGSFSIMKKKRWKYSWMVEDLEKAWKERKKLEEQLGDATFEEIDILTFREKNEGSEA